MARATKIDLTLGKPQSKIGIGDGLTHSFVQGDNGACIISAIILNKVRNYIRRAISARADLIFSFRTVVLFAVKH